MLQKINSANAGTGSRAAGDATSIALFCLSTLAWHAIAYGFWQPAFFCCDATQYLISANRLLSDFYSTDIVLSGYRSNVCYVLIGLVKELGGLFVQKNPLPESLYVASTEPAYALGAYLLFLGTGSALLAVRNRIHTSLSPILGIYFNPITVAFVPLPMQESLYVLLLAPLLVASCWALERHAHAWAAGLLCSTAAAAYIIKPSFLIASVLMLCLAAHHLYKAAWRGRIISVAASLVVAAVLIGPQSAVMKYHFNTWHPYPNTDIREFQLKTAWEMWRYETIFINDLGHPRAFTTPFKAPERPLYSLLQEPAKGWVLVWGHLFGAFDFSTLQTYVKDTEMPRSPVGNIMVGIVVIGALFRILSWRAYKGRDLLLDSLLVATIAPLPLIAVESRFALIPMMVFGVRAAEWARRSPPVWQWLVASGVAVAFATLILVGQLVVAS